MLRVVNFIIFVFSLFVPLLVSGKVHADPLQPTLIFSEVKVRTDTTNLQDYDEFIEIYNATDAAVDLADYNLEYYNVTNPAISQQPIQKPLFNFLLDAHASLALAKQPIQILHSKQSPFTSLSDSGGRLRLVTAEGVVIDEVAWTNSQILATTDGVYPAIVYQCNSSTVLCTSNRVQSLSRSQDQEGNFVLSIPTWALSAPTPNSSELLSYPVTNPTPEYSDPTIDSEQQDELPQPAITCEGIIITELMPNPAGSDTGKEYIELYNPTNEVINLSGCALQTSSNTKKYALPNLAVNPGVYTVFSDLISGLTLPNTAGGTVWLLSPTEELQSITYPGSLAEDTSWSLINTTWEISYLATPGASNISQSFQPCTEGQTRNSFTNRCQAPTVAAVANLASCKTGQERNPETNRCRTVSATMSALMPCKEGQERNPETNRCRTVQSNDLEPCAEGQERNPDTNRCRKLAESQGQTLAAVKDVSVPTTAGHPKWWLAVAAVILAVGYALYEWRKDFLEFARNIKLKVVK